MTITERRRDTGSTSPAGSVPLTATGRSTNLRGFRPASRRRTRLAVGTVLAAVAIGGNVLLYASVDDRTEVLQLARDVRAGEVIGADDLRVVGADVDPLVPVVAAADAAGVLGSYARTYLAAGSLLTAGLVQAEPLVAAGTAIVAIEIAPAHLPAGLTTRSRVLLVVPQPGGVAFTTTGRVVRRPDADDASTMSVEVSEDVAALVAAADGVRVVLVEPGVDPATETGAGGR